MIDVGITDLAIYVPQLYLSHEELAGARGVDPAKYVQGLGCRSMAILPEWEDSVTMAANAAGQLLEKTRTDPGDIHQMVVSTESGVDHSKPVASFVQGLLNIGSRCRIYEIKHACYGGTAGIVNSIDWIYRNYNAQKKALVITSDTARYGFDSAGEPTQGAGAVALLLERNPRFCSVDTSLNGIFSENVFDFWRPTGHRVPIVDGKYSIKCYLEALEASVSHFCTNLGIRRSRLLQTLDYLVYHMPFPNMALKAHRHLVDVTSQDLAPDRREEVFRETWERMVEPGLLGAREVGNIYTGSVYMGLVSLLEAEKEKIEGRRVGIFSYGSGCGAEFFLCHVKKGVGDIISRLGFTNQLARRRRISFEQYVEIYEKDRKTISYHPDDVLGHKDPFTRFVYTGLKDHKRQYA